jgi:hypothetical protein
MVDKPFFTRNAAAITRHRTIFADNSMTGMMMATRLAPFAEATARGRRFTYIHGNGLIMRRLAEANAVNCARPLAGTHCLAYQAPPRMIGAARQNTLLFLVAPAGCGRFLRDDAGVEPSLQVAEFCLQRSSVDKFQQTNSPCVAHTNIGPSGVVKR